MITVICCEIDLQFCRRACTLTVHHPRLLRCTAPGSFTHHHRDGFPLVYIADFSAAHCWVHATAAAAVHLCATDRFSATASCATTSTRRSSLQVWDALARIVTSPCHQVGCTCLRTALGLRTHTGIGSVGTLLSRLGFSFHALLLPARITPPLYGLLLSAPHFHALRGSGSTGIGSLFTHTFLPHSLSACCTFCTAFSARTPLAHLRSALLDHSGILFLRTLSLSFPATSPVLSRFSHHTTTVGHTCTAVHWILPGWITHLHCHLDHCHTALHGSPPLRTASASAPAPHLRTVACITAAHTVHLLLHCIYTFTAHSFRTSWVFALRTSALTSLCTCIGYTLYAPSACTAAWDRIGSPSIDAESCCALHWVHLRTSAPHCYPPHGSHLALPLHWNLFDSAPGLHLDVAPLRRALSAPFPLPPGMHLDTCTSVALCTACRILLTERRYATAPSRFTPLHHCTTCTGFCFLSWVPPGRISPLPHSPSPHIHLILFHTSALCTRSHCLSFTSADCTPFHLHWVHACTACIPARTLGSHSRSYTLHMRHHSVLPAHHWSH